MCDETQTQLHLVRHVGLSRYKRRELHLTTHIVPMVMDVCKIWVTAVLSAELRRSCHEDGKLVGLYTTH